ncbi:hypothetical protein GGR51DRAFT_553874 [Nemania sp. FL0031]|nr:hypothetical protein GGR51DRAFT_553874 [Nemania sp. FL0031]
MESVQERGVRFKWSKFDTIPRKFAPEGTFERLMTVEFIRGAMGIEECNNEDQGLVDFIRRGAKRLFAISINIGLKEGDLKRAMSIFKDNSIDDKSLPIDDPTNDESTLPNASYPHGLNSQSSPDPTRNVTLNSLELSVDAGNRVWSEHRIDDFHEKQWMFLAPVFSIGVPSYRFETLRVLPFISKSKDPDSGSFGQVYKFEIHPDHIQPVQKSLAIAVKQLRPTSEKDKRKVFESWNREARALQNMNSLNQKHIVRFITAFCRGRSGEEEYYLMFEWADGGNLRSLWKEHRQPLLNFELVNWAITQIKGLFEALSAAHNPNTIRPGETSIFRHGDLKPANILWFKDGSRFGTLKICDWGLAKEHNVETALRFNSTTTRSGTWRYEAPEVETGVNPAHFNQTRNRRSRLHDIWAMGCICLEFIVWILYGWDGLMKFDSSFSGTMPFYQITKENGRKVAMVHDVVIRWMDHMASQAACEVGETALGDLLEVVRDGLLVVNSNRRVESYDSTHPHPHENQTTPSQRTDLLNLTDAASTLSLDLDAPQRLQKGENIPITQTIPSLAQGNYRNGRSNRLHASQVLKRLEPILAEPESETSFWNADKPNLPDRVWRIDDNSWSNLEPTSSESRNYTNNTSARPLGEFSGSSQLVPRALVVPEPKKLDNIWELIVDNDFATRILDTLGDDESFQLPATPRPGSLCPDCEATRDGLWSSNFSVTYKTTQLEARARSDKCNLCRLLWKMCQKRGAATFPTVKFDRSESSLKINSDGPAVLSIVRSIGGCRGLRGSFKGEIQVGFPNLPLVNSPAYFEIIRHWLRICDDEHGNSCCRQSIQGNLSLKGKVKRLPRRLIDVGKDGDSTIRLTETTADDTGNWIALSHQWGSGRHFVTDRKNLPDHIRGMDFHSLPATFKDAVVVTRRLGCRYLWIDCICIIQGNDGDFNEEARRMEEVYSGAYCVIAASRATSHFSGFLQSRSERDFVAMHRANETPFYLCEAIDDFNGHVLEGALHSRGWVLQEHALARRTIFFTEHQTYWECGDGVRCETMTKMNNNLAAFLGDPNFPQIVMDAQQGEKIIRYQNLYRMYSTLALSNSFDRPMAIDGLERRLLDKMKARGGYGILDEGKTKGLLRRSLLWCRGDKTPNLSRIRFPTEAAFSAVPSWSWMAYTGGIDYLDIEFGGVEWEDLRSPWWSDSGHVQRTEDAGRNIFLTAVARDYESKATVTGKNWLVFDSPGESKRQETKCVVLGKQKGPKGSGDKLNYVLLIMEAAARNPKGEKVYERVGAGYLEGRLVAPEGELVKIY